MYGKMAVVWGWDFIVMVLWQPVVVTLFPSCIPLLLCGMLIVSLRKVSGEGHAVTFHNFLYYY